MRKTRTCGLSLIEIVVSMFVMSIISAAVILLAVSQNAVTMRTFSKSSALLSGRQLQQYLEKDLHQAKFIGNFYASDGKPNYFPDSYGNPPVSAFPSTTANSQWEPAPYILDSRTLFFQVPVFTNDGNKIPTLNTLGNPNCDTYVYKVLPDTSKPGLGRYIIQRQVFAGEHGPLSEPFSASSEPKTIVKDIVGPIDPTEAVDGIAGTPRPKVFTFFSRKTPIWDPLKTIALNEPKSSDVDDLYGISVNIELFSNEASQNKDLTPSTVAFRSEYFMRSNNLNR